MVGVGSVGTRCYIMLMVGRDHNDPLFLQIKEAEASVLERFIDKSTYSHHGHRVVAGQRLMQAADIFLGWIRIKGLDGVTRDYYVRQFQDWKGGADIDSMLVPGATLYSRICGATLARAMPAGATGSPSPLTSVTGMPSTGRSRTSPPPTLTRTNGTTKRSPPLSAQDGWSRKAACRRAWRTLITRRVELGLLRPGAGRGKHLHTFP